MPDSKHEVELLREQVAHLTERVWRLEQQSGIAAPLQVAAPPPPVESTPGPQQTPESRGVVEPVPRASEPPYPLMPTFGSVSSDEALDHDLESRIGSQWLNRIGIVAVLIGVSYFLKYAFENNWIGALGRVTIGILAGIGVFAWSERFRTRGHTAFSLSLKAVGAGTLYLSLWAAFQLYHLVPSFVAFGAMVAVTGFIGLLAVRQDSQILAAMALSGGFATPILLSTGQNQQVALFTYLLVLDVATVALIAYKPWRVLLTISFVATTLFYVGWYLTFYDRTPTFATTFAFATLFFATFAAAPLLARPIDDRLSRTLIALPLLNAAVYFLQGYALLEESDRSGWHAWFAVALAAVYIVLSRQARLRQAAGDESSRTLVRLLYVAIAVAFVTIAIPLKLERHWITLGWLVESAVLIWVGFRVQSTFIKTLAVIALALGVARLLLWDNFGIQPLLFNIRFVTYLVAIAALGFGAWVARNSADLDERKFVAVAIVAMNVLALTALTAEVDDIFEPRIQRLYQAGGTPQNWQMLRDDYRDATIGRNFSYSAVWMAYGAALMWAGFAKRWAFLRWQALVLLAITTVKVFLYDTSQLDRVYRIVSFIVLGALLLAVSYAYQRDWLKKLASEEAH